MIIFEYIDIIKINLKCNPTAEEYVILTSDQIDFRKFVSGMKILYHFDQGWFIGTIHCQTGIKS